MSTPSGEPRYEVSPVHQQANGEADHVTPVTSFTSFSSADSNSAGMKRYRDLPQRSSNEALKAHTNFSIRLSETAVEFVQKMASVEEQHARQINNVVASYKKKTSETLKKDLLMTGGSCFTAWEAMLAEAEKEAKTHVELAQKLSQSVSNQLSELTARKRILKKKWFTFRDVYMSHVDKTEDHVSKLHREYQDHWQKYAEALGRSEENIKDSMVLRSYNAHNEYIMQMSAFNSLHDEFYNKQIYDMLDELQAIHEDLVKGFKHCMQKKIQLTQAKHNASLVNLGEVMESFNSISAPADISSFVSGQNVTVKVYPPPKAEYKPPELPPPKQPDAPPINLAPLGGELQLVDLTQAPLLNAQESIKKNESDITSALDQLHKEYQSVKTLLDSYRENPSLGDPNSLIEELLEMRNKIRIKETDLIMIRGKLSLFTPLSSNGEAGSRSSAVLEEAVSPTQLESGKPTKSNEKFVIGRNHEFVDSDVKFRIPPVCAYCSIIIQPPIYRGVKCKVCKMHVHTKCQQYIPYCSGHPPTKSPKFMAKAQKRISKMLTRKASNAPSESNSESFDDDEDETLGGIYEAPPAPPSKPTKRVASPQAPELTTPKPPPRGESLDPKYGALGNALLNSFEDTVEFTASCSYCVALYDYDKTNPNDMSLSSGDVIELINTASNDWWKGSVGEMKGYFPASYVQLETKFMNKFTAIEPEIIIRLASRGDTVMRALYDFTPQSAGEIHLETGQIVLMIRNDGDGWLHGKTVDDEGLYPENYVEKLTVV